MGIKVELSDEAKQFVAQHGYDVQFGARPLKRAIQNYIEDELAEMIVNDDLPSGSTIRVSKDSENKLKFEKIL